MRIKKKHEAGAAKNFITRTQAVKKLQLSLADFRRLCIFKGIYPREPRNKKKANKGSTAPTTFYYTKDIQYLMHEPVIQKFREHKVFAKKLSKLLGRGEVGDAKRLDDNRPRYRLDHIIKERYPTFLDAIRDLDDALSMLFLFAAMPATDKVSSRVTLEAERLCNQWMAYVAREGLLRKVFISIKGVYFQAEVKGQEVLWLVPFKFPQNVPTDIDFRIMLTFLEFYTTLLQFVQFRLFTEAGLVYPPKIDTQKVLGVGGVSAYLLESKQEQKLLAATAPATMKASAKQVAARVKTLGSVLEKAAAAGADEDEEPEDEVEADDDKLDTFVALPATETAVSDVLPQPEEVSAETRLKTLMAPFTFYIGREVNLDIVEFAILALGGRVISESALGAELQDLEDDEENDNAATLADKKQRRAEIEAVQNTVTHQICDRPALASRVPGRIYVQPQWVFDSLNRGELLPVDDYSVGASLPPHLSPWGDGGIYDPEALAAAEAEADGELESEEEEDEIEGEVEPDEDEDDVDEDEEENLRHQLELEAEAKGVEFSEQTAGKRKRGAAAAAPVPETKAAKKKKLAKDEKEAKEEKELRKIMMTNKQKKLYNQMQYGIKQKEDRAELLKKKKKKLQKAQ
ncbi:Pescadillo N-terminus-domain-containing protein [Dipodascopsis tothii]|uniref:Pescadillo N-terminus-domain-containing protein n=1 Tax=Dipodascopsis tothii TaxID=44089 RepID=UPI0034CF4815